MQKVKNGSLGFGWIKWLCIILIVSIGLAGGLFLNSIRTNTAYINTQKVYEEFLLKKELEAKLYKIQKDRNAILDSLRQELQLLSKEIELEKNKDPEKMNRFMIRREELLYKQEQFGKEDETLAAEYREQIWNQLNQYIKEYGKENSYDYIFGADGQGALMYAEDSRNISEEVLKYVNNKYEGKN